MKEQKLRVYGLRLTRKQYLVAQVVGFVWLLGLYGVWKRLGLETHKTWLVRNLDVLLLVLYLYGVAETWWVLRRFKRAAKGGKDTSDKN